MLVRCNLYLYLPKAVGYIVMIWSHPLSFCAFTVLPDRPLQWTTSWTRAQAATSWRFPRRTTTITSTSTSRIRSWVQTFRGWTLCVALSRAIWILTVLGPLYMLPLDVMMRCTLYDVVLLDSGVVCPILFISICIFCLVELCFIYLL